MPEMTNYMFGGDSMQSRTQLSSGHAFAAVAPVPAFPADIPVLRALLGGGVLSLLRLPAGLEAAFHSHFRTQAADVLRRSIYGLMLLYLSVVVPVALFSGEQEQRAYWLDLAVFPIGGVLLVVWASTLLRELSSYVEATLGAGVFACLCGTAYCAIQLGDNYFGQVAAYETIYVLVVAFTLLRMPTVLVLCSALSACAVVLTVADVNGLSPDWLDMLLYFLVPLLLCAVSGYMLEYAARRDFLQTLCHRQEKSQLLHDMAAMGNDGDDVHGVLEFVLARICTNMGWISGSGSLAFPEEGERALVRHVNRDAESCWAGYLEGGAPLQVSALGREVLASGRPAWKIQSVHLQDMLDDTSASHLAFPVIVGDEAVAVLEFLSARHEEPDEHLLSLMEQVGQNLSRIFERRRKQRELRERALYDALTGLPNRAYFFDHLRAALARAQCNPHYHFCVLFLDLDRFKWVNDSLGHVNGDRLLIEFGHRVRQGLRPNDVVARLGGDEFAVLVDDIREEADAIRAAEDLQQRLQQPISIAGHDITAGSSIGIAMSARHYCQPEEMLRDADTAMYMAKQSRRGTYVFFTAHMREKAVDRLRLVGELRRAIDGDGLVLHYQPIVSLMTGRVDGFEALIRWHHPELGLVSPEDFIPIAEETGLIIPLTRWVIANACRQLGDWQRRVPHSPPGMSVNLCAQYFVEAGMPDEIHRTMSEHGVRQGSLRLEITETQLIDNTEQCMHNIHRLGESGVPVYIDDFGTGYSSLNYLASFRVNALKIDRSFMSGLEKGGKEAIVVRAIASLSQHLGLDVIAEGVETAAQLACLQELGCQYAQGFLLSKALPADRAFDLIGQQLLPSPAQIQAIA